VELLRRSRSSEPDSCAGFPRSEIIQNLAVFASYLDTIIKPHEGNYHVAQQGQRTIRHILDQVLSTEGLSCDMRAESRADDLSIPDETVLNSVDLDNHDMFLGWLDENIQMSESWLTWVNLN
jgi:chromatin structure-remodeling complex subunit RSC3/30